MIESRSKGKYVLTGRLASGILVGREDEEMDEKDMETGGRE